MLKRRLPRLEQDRVPELVRDRGRLARIGAGEARRWRQARRGGVVEHRQLVDGPVHLVPARQPVAHPGVEDVTVVGDRQHRGVAPRQDRGKVTRGGLLRHFGGEAARVLSGSPTRRRELTRRDHWPGAGGWLVRADAEAVAGEALAGPDGGAGVRVGEQDAWLPRGWLAYGISPGRMTS